MMRPHFLLLKFARALLIILIALMPFTIFAASHSWLGNTSAFWTVASNWTNGTPGGGDDLYFVSGGLNNRSNFNNFPTGFAFGSITISEGNNIGYVLAGNPITLNNGLFAFGTLLSAQPQVDFNITCGSSVQTWSSARSLAINGTVDLRAGWIYVNNSGGVTINGTITDSSTGGVNGTVVKTNSGLLYFSAGSRVDFPYYNNDGSLGYPLEVGSGHLRFDGVATNGELDLSPKPYTVIIGTNYGSTLVDGTGSIDSMDMEGGTLSPGDGAPGILHCEYLTFFGTFNILINGTNAGTDYSQLASGNNPAWDGVYLGGGTSTGCPAKQAAILNLQFGYTPQIGDSYLIINGLTGGYFDGLSGNSMFETNGSAFGVLYSSNSVTVTDVWDPTSPYILWNGSTNLNNRYWSTTNNWLNGTVPTNGSRLEFTAYQTRDQSFCWPYATNNPPLTNDLGGGTSIASIQLTGSGYSIYGNPLTVTEGITNSISSGTNSFYCNMVGSGSTALAVNDGSVLKLNGQFVGGGTFHKQGGGELYIGGTTHFTYAGSMAVEAGTVRVDGAFLDGSWTVSAGTLTGGGAVSATTLNGGTLSPGDGTGVMQVQGNLTMNAASVLQLELNGTNAGVSYDQLQVNGAVNINGAVLDLRPTNNFVPGTAFVVLLNDGTDAISGTFAGLPEGAVFSAGGQYFEITYVGGTGNDVVITRTDPPATFTSIIRSATNAVQMAGTGGTNLYYTIQATTNLTTKIWTDVGTAPVDGSGHFIFTDTNLLLYPQRFFRAVAP